MRQVLNEIEFMILDAFIYIFAMTVAFAFIRVESSYVDTVSTKINQKTNVYEINDDTYEKKEYLVSSASILYDVLSCEKGTAIVIDGYKLTDDDWKKILEEGDKQCILSHIKFNLDYLKTYTRDDEGLITGIKYTPDY